MFWDDPVVVVLEPHWPELNVVLPLVFVPLASKIRASAPCLIASFTAGLMLSLFPVSHTAKGALSTSM